MIHDLHILAAQVFQVIEAHKAAIAVGLGWLAHFGIPRAWKFLGDNNGMSGIIAYMMTGTTSAKPKIAPMENIGHIGN